MKRLMVQRPKTDTVRGGGQVVNGHVFYSDSPSSMPTEVYNFYCVKTAWKERK